MGKIERPSLESLIMDFATSLTKRATCKRFQVGCVLTSEDMTQIYGFGYNGTGKGLPHDDCKPDQQGACGCFVAGSLIATEAGPREIQRVRVGDRLLTHEGCYRPVQQTFRHIHEGVLMQLFLETGTPANMVRRKTATIEHPFMVKRNGRADWLEARFVVPGDYLAIAAIACPGCGKAIPHYRRYCPRCFQESTKTAEIRRRLSERMKNHNPMKGIHIYDPSRAAITLAQSRKETTQKVFRELISVQKEYEANGWRTIIIDHCVRPDLVAIKDAKVVGVEYDRRLWPNKSKYDGHPDVRSQYDDIIWHGKHDSTWEPFNDVFVWAKVSLVTSKVVHQPVYNLEVAEDNSFTAQNAVVHNCVHSEVNALIKVRVNDPRKVVFVTAQPCVTCAKAIVNSGVSKVYYRASYRSNEGLDLIQKVGIEVERV